MENEKPQARLCFDPENRAVKILAQPSQNPVEYSFRLDQMPVLVAREMVFCLMEQPQVAQAVMEESQRIMGQQRDYDATFLNAAGVVAE